MTNVTRLIYTRSRVRSPNRREIGTQPISQPTSRDYDSYLSPERILFIEAAPLDHPAVV